jgi:hypothetical protein
MLYNGDVEIEINAFTRPMSLNLVLQLNGTNKMKIRPSTVSILNTKLEWDNTPPYA